jgi:hypothetical protein
MTPDPQKIIDWLNQQGCRLAIGTMAWGNRVFVVQDGRHGHEAFDTILKRVEANRPSLLEYMTKKGEVECQQKQPLPHRRYSPGLSKGAST